jgi:hypothetical protein
MGGAEADVLVQQPKRNGERERATNWVLVGRILWSGELLQFPQLLYRASDLQSSTIFDNVFRWKEILLLHGHGESAPILPFAARRWHGTTAPKYKKIDAHRGCALQSMAAFVLEQRWILVGSIKESV